MAKTKKKRTEKAESSKMKFRIKNKETNRFVSKPTGYYEAKKYAELLNSSSKGRKYGIVSTAETIKELPGKPREMTDDEKRAIKSLRGISFAKNTMHGQFTNILLAKLDTGDFTITEKQSVYLWWIVYHYRRQIANPVLIQLAEQNRIENG
jgi:hypothetical protein